MAKFYTPSLALKNDRFKFKQKNKKICKEIFVGEQDLALKQHFP